MKTSRLLCSVLVSMGLAIALTSCHGASVLVVGVDIKQIPLSYTDGQNTISGFEVDMATEAAKRAGMTVEFVPINWAQKEKSLEDGKVNSLWGEIAITPEEKQNILFTKPYMYNSHVFIISSDSNITSKLDLTGLTVGTIQGSEAAADLVKDSISAQFAGGGPQIFNDSNTIFTALQSGQIDAVAVDETMGEYYINQNTFDYKVLPDKLSTVQYAVGVRRDDGRLRNSLQAALDSMVRDGTSKAISMKWFGKDYTLK